MDGRKSHWMLLIQMCIMNQSQLLKVSVKNMILAPVKRWRLSKTEPKYSFRRRFSLIYWYGFIKILIIWRFLYWGMT